LIQFQEQFRDKRQYWYVMNFILFVSMCRYLYL